MRPSKLPYTNKDDTKSERAITRATIRLADARRPRKVIIVLSDRQADSAAIEKGHAGTVMHQGTAQASRVK
jgi:hypothetical protein